MKFYNTMGVPTLLMEENHVSQVNVNSVTRDDVSQDSVRMYKI